MIIQCNHCWATKRYSLDMILAHMPCDDCGTKGEWSEATYIKCTKCGNHDQLAPASCELAGVVCDSCKEVGCFYQLPF